MHAAMREHVMGNTSPSPADSKRHRRTRDAREEVENPPRNEQGAEKLREAAEEVDSDDLSSLDKEVESQRLHSFPKPPVLELEGPAYGVVEYQEGQDRAEVSFIVVLNCTGEEKSSLEHNLVIKDGMPRRVRDLKTCIEQEYSIPACCQTLVFESVTMEDQFSLEFYHVRDGDTISVFYMSKGDVSAIIDIVDHIIKSYRIIQSIQEKLRNHVISDDLDMLVSQNVFWQKVNDLPEVYFTPCSSHKAEANRNLFVQCGGLDMLQRLHGLLLQQPWSNMPLKMQYLEHSILRTYWNVTAAFTVRMYVLQYPRTLSYILRSFLRVELNSREHMQVGKNIYAMREASRGELNRIASEVVYKAMGALCNLAEIPECRMQIASSKSILKQLVATLMTPAYNSIASLVAMAGMLCLAYSSETHRYLSTPEIMDGVLQACTIRRPDYINPIQSKLKILLLKYFANVLFAQLLTTSPHLVTKEMKLKLLPFMEDFLEHAKYKEIREEEVRNGYKWSTLIPFMKLAYHPVTRLKRASESESTCETSRDDLKAESAGEASGGDLKPEEQERLDRCCIQCGIFSLSNVLLCQETREIYIQEGLLDYTVSMPWIYPLDWPERKEARRLVTFLGQNVQLQPPSLINLTKARLASMHFGLEKVIRTDSVHELLAEVYS